MSGARRKAEIPVLWDCGARGIPIAITAVNGVRRMAAARGYAVRLYEGCEQLLADSPAHLPVIVVGSESTRMPIVLHQLQRASRCVVVTSMDADHIDAHYSCSTFSRRIATEQLLEFMLDKGCRRIALVGCGDRSVNDMVHSDAMERYLRKSGRARGRSFWYQARISESFESFLSQKANFDAVLCPNDFAAVAFMRFLENRGVRVPEDLLLASFKSNFISEYCKPSITSFMVDFYAMGENAVTVWTFLADAGNDRLQMRITVPGRIVERESTGKEAPAACREPDLDGVSSYQGGPFYDDPMLQSLMRVERCFQSCDELDLRIIGLMLDNCNYEYISDALFLSGSSLQYRARKIFRMAETENRRDFINLLRGCFTREHHLSQSGPVIDDAHLPRRHE